MVYARQTWVDGSGGGTPVNATRLTVIEDGIFATATQITPSADKTANYVLVAADAGTRVVVNSATAKTVTINTPVHAAGDRLEIWQRGAGQVTVTAGAGVTLRAPLGAKTRVQYSAVRVWFLSATEAVVDGDATV